MPDPDAHRFVADDATADRLARALLRVQGRRPLTVVVVVLLVLAVACAVRGLGAGAVVCALAAVCLPAMLRFGARRQCRALVPPGTTFELELGPEHLVIRTQRSRAELPLASLRAVRVVDGFVFLRTSQVRGWQAVPQEVVPDAALERLRQECQRRT